MSEGSLYGIIVLAIIGVVVIGIIKAFVPMGEKFCTACGHEGPSKLRTKGNIGIEIVLWLFFILPGLIYSIWRHASRGHVCSSCGSEALVPPESPMARKLRADLAPK